MKSPSYILKNSYHERIQTRGLEKHFQKLEQINYQPQQVVVQQKTQEVDKILDVRNRNQQIANKFNEMETVLERNRENEILIGKIKNLQHKPMSRQAKSSFQQKSLIQESKRKEENRIIMENFNLAKRMIGLPPVISNKKFDQEYQQHQNDLNLLKRYHSVKPLNHTKSTALFTQLNRITNQKFLRSKSSANLPYVLKQLNENNQLCLIQLKSVKLINPANQTSRIPTQYFWELLHKGKVVTSTHSTDFDQATQELVDFVAPTNGQFTLVLRKLKNNDDIYVGQFDINLNEQTNIDNINKLVVNKSDTFTCDLVKQIESMSAVIGEITYRLITVQNIRKPKVYMGSTEPRYLQEQRTQDETPENVVAVSDVKPIEEI